MGDDPPRPPQIFSELGLPQAECDWATFSPEKKYARLPLGTKIGILGMTKP